MALAIIGVGTVCALGCGVGALRAGLRGEARPEVEVHDIATPGGVVRLPVYMARPDGLERFMPKRSLRRVDRFARMALLASFLALEDAGIEPADRARVGIVFGSGYGPLQTTFDFQDSMIDFGDKCASPTHFANSVHNAPAAQVSMALRIEGPCQTVTCFEWTTAGVLKTAQAWLSEGVVDYVLAGVGEEYCPLRGYAAAGLGAGGDCAIAPFDFERCTYAPGEGFAAFLLRDDAVADAQYGRIEDVRVSQDAALIKERLETHQAVFLAACGAKQEGAAYRKITFEGLNYAAHAPLYGSMPVGLGFELAAAALSIADRRLYLRPSARADAKAEGAAPSQTLSAGAALACVQAVGDSGYALISLREVGGHADPAAMRKMCCEGGWMNENWNISGLILEGICGSGKTTILHSLLRSERFVLRSFPSSIVLSEHQTQRVLERKERETGLTPEDNVGLLEQHVSYLEAARDRLTQMEWCENKRTNMRVPYLLERFHFTHVCHYSHVTWEHVSPIDHRLAKLDCKLCLLVIPDELLRERIITGRDSAWHDYLKRYGATDEEILQYYTTQQNILRDLLARSELETRIIDTGAATIDQAMTQVLDFWGAV